MNDTSPAFSDIPMTFPSASFQVSSLPKPRTSRYQLTLFSRSPTVRLGDAERSASGPPDAGRDFAVTAFGLRGELFFARDVFVVFFFTGISNLQASEAMADERPPSNEKNERGA